jgi:hypothetical protein
MWFKNLRGPRPGSRELKNAVGYVHVLDYLLFFFFGNNEDVKHKLLFFAPEDLKGLLL